MSFGFVPAVVGVLGLAAIAGLLFALQRLRVRHRPVQVETALFWQQAVEESRARVLTQRFRHPWTYLLLLLISSLLWLSFAGLQSDAGRDRRYVVLLDGSAGMAHGDRFARAAAVAAEYAEGLPVDARTVLFCGGRTQTLLRAGEDALLLRRRLDDVGPVAAPSSTVAELFDVVRSRAEVPTTVCVVGDLPITADERALLPDSVELLRLAAPARTGANVGVTALGVRPAASMRAEAVDVLVELSGTGGAELSPPALRLDGRAWSAAPVGESFAGGRRFRYVDVPAKGQLLEVSVGARDALSLDDAAAFTLPDHSRIPVAIGPDVPAVIRRVVATDPGLVVRAADAVVAVRTSGTTLEEELPSLVLSDPQRVANAFLISHEEGLDPAAVLAQLYEDLGLNQIDAMAAAAAIGRDVSVGARPAPRRELAVWRPLLDPDHDFVRSRSFPLFIGLGLRWLAGVEPGPVRVAAGEPVAVGDVEVAADARRARSFSERFVPRVAGRVQPAGTAPLHASLLDPVATGVPRAGAVEVDALSAGASDGLDLVTILLLSALLLLAAEWVLFRSSRIP